MAEIRSLDTDMKIAKLENEVRELKNKLNKFYDDWRDGNRDIKRTLDDIKREV